MRWARGGESEDRDWSKDDGGQSIVVLLALVDRLTSKSRIIRGSSRPSVLPTITALQPCSRCLLKAVDSLRSASGISEGIPDMNYGLRRGQWTPSDQATLSLSAQNGRACGLGVERPYRSECLELGMYSGQYVWKHCLAAPGMRPKS